MTIVSQERRSFAVGEGKGKLLLVLYADTAPASLEISGTDIGLTDDDIAVGSMLLTPGKRYIYNEAGAFVETSW